MDWHDLDYQLSQLRHAYSLLVNGHVKNHKQFADGLIAPAIRLLENYIHQEKNNA